MAEEIRWIGLLENKINETLKNTTLTNLIVEVVRLAKENLSSNERTIDKLKVSIIDIKCHLILIILSKNFTYFEN